METPGSQKCRVQVEPGAGRAWPLHRGDATHLHAFHSLSFHPGCSHVERGVLERFLGGWGGLPAHRCGGPSVADRAWPTEGDSAGATAPNSVDIHSHSVEIIICAAQLSKPQNEGSA
jgi:hypothetical protein